jgi:hypothetical protein
MVGARPPPAILSAPGRSASQQPPPTARRRVPPRSLTACAARERPGHIDRCEKHCASCACPQNPNNKGLTQPCGVPKLCSRREIIPIWRRNRVSMPHGMTPKNPKVDRRVTLTAPSDLRATSEIRLPTPRTELMHPTRGARAARAGALARVVRDLLPGAWDCSDSRPAAAPARPLERALAGSGMSIGDWCRELNPPRLLARRAASRGLSLPHLPRVRT